MIAWNHEDVITIGKFACLHLLEQPLANVIKPSLVAAIGHVTAHDDIIRALRQC
ncbi:hypothetical protein X741_34585 [Mesorhizobium sp. LNHC229A00]|nr:hypothetical protein X741_34585 [Mesorhizobium sp. LNHC229A00]